LHCCVSETEVSSDEDDDDDRLIVA